MDLLLKVSRFFHDLQEDRVRNMKLLSTLSTLLCTLFYATYKFTMIFKFSKLMILTRELS